MVALPQPTQGGDLAKFYDGSAAFYSQMMDDEMTKYAQDFDKIVASIPSSQGTVFDTCFGSGHMLVELHRRCPQYTFVGMDLSPAMLEEGQKRASEFAQLGLGNMLDVSTHADASCVLVLNCFAAHHVTETEMASAITEYARILKPGGCLYFSSWEGQGVIDYGEEGVTAFKYPRTTMEKWVAEAGLRILSIREAIEEELGMNSCYIIAQKST